MGIEERSLRSLVFNLRLTLAKEANADTIQVLKAVPPRPPVGVSATVRALLEYAVRRLGDKAADGQADDGLKELTPAVWRAIPKRQRGHSARGTRHAQLRNP